MVILSALEIDLDFNVNVITGSDGVMRGASGGHCDVAAGGQPDDRRGPADPQPHPDRGAPRDDAWSRRASRSACW